jgi:hypothetical protein
MMRKRSMSGLLVIAVMALSASFAAGAQAGEFTGVEAGKHVKTILDGIGTGNQVFSTPKGKVTCTGFLGSGELATGKSKTLTTEQLVYNDCTSTVATDTTITMNGCHYKFEEPKAKGKGYTIPTLFLCPKAKRVEIHIYTAKDHLTSLCTVTMYPQGPGGEEEGEFEEEELEGENTAENLEKELEGGSVQIFTTNFNFKNVNYEEHGAKCPDGDKSKVGGTLTGVAEWRGTNTMAQLIDAFLSG